MLDSTVKVKTLARQCKEFGLPAFALTGHDSLSSVVQGWQQAKEFGLKYIAGLEAYFCDDIKVKDPENKYSHLILLAKNDTGLENLQILSTKAWLEGFYYKPRIDWNLLEQHSNGLIVADACLGGVIKKKFITYFKALELQNEELAHQISQDIDNTIKRFINIIGQENFYFELQPNGFPEQEVINQILVKSSYYYGVETIVTTDVHYLRPEDKKTHAILLKSEFNNEREQGEFYDYTYLMTRQEIEDMLIPQIGEEETDRALNNTLKIAEKVEEYTIEQPPLLPNIDIPKFEFNDILQPYYNKYPYIKQFRYSEDENDRYWYYLIEKGFTEKGIIHYPNKDEYIERINTELWVFDSYKDSLNAVMSKYTNGVVTIFDIIRDDCDSLISAGRGSSGGNLTNYLSGITELDPVELNLPWWRFGHPERPDFFDIDFDSEAAKKELIDYKVKEYFGEDKVIHLCTFGTISSRSAILTVARSLDIPIDEAQKISSLIPSDRGKNRPLEVCLYGNKEEGFEPIPELVKYQKEYPELFKYAIELNGIIDKRSSHASGKVILPVPYTKVNAAMKTSSGLVVSQLDMADSYIRGCIKYDWLAYTQQSLIVVIL